ncbi:unnamed protein product [Lactuca saligna]|uniref:Acid phosphatase/vanadium-dependent haloperoxidase-related protein n=1 Tax=Lactuca saligna TaxID=75948 RepID=A0AA35ZM65_LACSI|nr:unnamed protein product [Lactuca saligna]
MDLVTEGQRFHQSNYMNSALSYLRCLTSAPPSTSPSGRLHGILITIADAAYRASKATETAATPSPSAQALSYSVPLLSAFLAFAIAQFLKVITTWYKERRWDPKKIVGSGGMPSSHSSTVVALAVSIGLHEGIESSTFAIAVVLAFIVMYDASGVRLHAGRQAEVLNQIVCEFPPEHPLSTSRPLRDSLGHTPLQVIAGGVLGVMVAFVMKASD